MGDDLLDRYFTILFEWPVNWAKGRGCIAKAIALALYLIWFFVLMFPSVVVILTWAIREFFTMLND